MHYPTIKRIFDIIVSLICLVIFSPIILIIAIAVKLDSEGTILFRQERISKDNKPFMIHKFRTMFVQQEPSYSVTVGDQDVRITRVGRFLRRFRLDELPQFIDVLLGNMSLVGPRPHSKEHVLLYPKKYKKVLSILPGITGLGTVLYARKEAQLLRKSNDPELLFAQYILPRKLRIEEIYLKNRSMTLDLKILLRTVKVLLK